MFQHLVDFSLKNKAAVLALTAIVAVWGWLSFRDLTVEAFPDPTETQVQVITLYPGQPAEEVERQLGLPLERALNGIPQLSRLRNLSLFGLSYVTLTFNDGDRRALGAPASPRAAPRRGPARRHRPAARALRHAHRRGLPLHAGRRGRRPDEAPHASGLGGAARASSGSTAWPTWSASAGCSGRSTCSRTRRASPRTASPWPPLEQAHQERQRERLRRRAGARRRAVRHPQRGPLHQLEDLKAVRLATEEGTPVFLKDVATVTEGWSPRQGVVSRNEPMDDVVRAWCSMRRGENPSAVLARLRAAVAGHRPRASPATA